MKRSIIMPQEIERQVRAYLFRNELEQGVFLFTHPVETEESLRLEVQDAYLVPPEGWKAQLEVYLVSADLLSQGIFL